MLPIFKKFRKEHSALKELLDEIAQSKKFGGKRKKLFIELRRKLTAHTLSEIEELYDKSDNQGQLNLMDMVHAYRKVMGIMDSIIELDYETDDDFAFIQDALHQRITLEESIMAQLQEL